MGGTHDEAREKGSASADGHVRHARNLDYMGVGHWDQEAAVLFYAPDEGQPYVSISSAGVPLGGITAMNQSGLTLAVHQHLGCLDFELGGMPVGLIGDQVMRHAHSLSEACAILDGHRPNGGWTYLVASATENAILCYEVTAARRAWKIATKPSSRPNGSAVHLQWSSEFFSAKQHCQRLLNRVVVSEWER